MVCPSVRDPGSSTAGHCPLPLDDSQPHLSSSPWQWERGRGGCAPTIQGHHAGATVTMRKQELGHEVCGWVCDSLTVDLGIPDTWSPVPSLIGCRDQSKSHAPWVCFLLCTKSLAKTASKGTWVEDSEPQVFWGSWGTALGKERWNQAMCGSLNCAMRLGQAVHPRPLTQPQKSFCELLANTVRNYIKCLL